MRFIICFLLIVLLTGCDNILNQNNDINIGDSEGVEIKDQNVETNESEELSEDMTDQHVESNESEELSEEVTDQKLESDKNNDLPEDIYDEMYYELDWILVDLDYLGSVKHTTYNELHYSNYPYIDENTEFTWWVHLQLTNDFTKNKYIDFDLPDDIDRSKKDIIVSYGRKLRYLYYENTYVPVALWGWDEHYQAEPVFERKYEKDSAHVYLVDKIKLVDNEFLSFDMSEFNKEGNVPFELPPYVKKPYARSRGTVPLLQ